MTTYTYLLTVIQYLIGYKSLLLQSFYSPILMICVAKVPLKYCQSFSIFWFSSNILDSPWIDRKMAVTKTVHSFDLWHCVREKLKLCVYFSTELDINILLLIW